MARSLGLAAYRVLSRRRASALSDPAAPRPKGDLVWLHATTTGRVSVLRDIAAKLKAQRPGLHVLLTLDEGVQLTGGARPGGVDLMLPYNSDHPQDAERFLSHWQPDLCVWTGGHLRHNTIAQANDAGVTLILADADTAGIAGAASGWLPTLMRGSLAAFSRIFATSAKVERRLLRLGVPRDRLSVTAPLQVSGSPLPTNEDEVADVAEMLGGRPVWLAVHVQQAEAAQVIAAHLNAQRLSHRLLLVLVPADVVQTSDMLDQVRGAGLRVIDWDAGEIPNDATQVIVSAGGRSLGLWYRTAPVCLVGSSLVPGYGGSDPFDAAALGSAVLYGPNVRDHLAAYTRLASAGAARIVKDADGLAAGVISLIAPDRAAAMALAAWEIVSEGAGGEDELIDAIQDRLDRRKRR